MAILNDHNLIWILVRDETKTNEFHCCAWDSRARSVNITVPLSSWLREMPWPHSPRGRERVMPGWLSALTVCQMTFERYKCYSCPHPLFVFFFYRPFLPCFFSFLSFLLPSASGVFGLVSWDWVFWTPPKSWLKAVYYTDERCYASWFCCGFFPSVVPASLVCLQESGIRLK